MAARWLATDAQVATTATSPVATARWVAVDPLVNTETLGGEGFTISASWVAPGASATGGSVSVHAEPAVFRFTQGPTPPSGPARVGLPGWVDTGIKRFFDIDMDVTFQNFSRRKTVIGVGGWELSQFIPLHTTLCIFPGIPPSTVDYVQEIRIQPPGGGSVVIDRIPFT